MVGAEKDADTPDHMAEPARWQPVNSKFKMMIDDRAYY